MSGKCFYEEFFSATLFCVKRVILFIFLYSYVININYIVKMLDAQAVDIEFYLMKISRLESDLAATQS